MSEETCYFLVQDGVVIQKQPGPSEGFVAGSCEWTAGCLYSNGVFSLPPTDWLAVNTWVLQEAKSSLSIKLLALKTRAEELSDAAELGMITPAETAEALALVQPLINWRAYRILLSRVITQPAWPENPVWPTPPAVWPA